MTTSVTPFERQRGTALFVGLIVLLLLSLAAVITANSSIMESKMATSERSAMLAQLAADSALNQAKTELTKAAAHGLAEVCRHLVCAERGDSQFASPQSFINSALARPALIPFRADPTLFPPADQAARWAKDPVYVIEDLGDALTNGTGKRRQFRVTARGIGPTSDYERIVEDIFSISY